MNANMKRLLIFALVPVTVWGIGSTYTAIKADRIAKNTETQITMSDTVRFSSGTATTVPYLDANKDLVSSAVTPTELGYLSGVTSAIQTQLGTKTDTGTANEITLTGTTIGLADDAIFPGTGAVTLPSGTTEQQPGAPTAGMIRYNSDDASFEGYTTEWGALGGGGAGGSRLQLFDDASFESGVANGTCTGCTASQETSVVLATTESALNAASLKMAFSAASGDYTWTETTGAQYSNVAGKVSAWIKTSASDCHFVEMVDGAESQTVPVSSDDTWKEYIINGTMGTTSYGYRVECNTSITDDVYVDETYAGAATPDTFDIGTASFYGSVKWETTANCIWARTSATTGAFAVDADCDNLERTVRGNYNLTDGSIGATDGQSPKIIFSKLEAGTYKLVAKGSFRKDDAGNTGCHWAFNDGTTTSTENHVRGNSGYQATGNIVGEFHYNTSQGQTTFEIYGGCQTAVQNLIESAVNGQELEISVYHYPSPQKVVAAKCDGLECENWFSAEFGGATHGTNCTTGNCTIRGETVDFLNTVTFSATGTYNVTYQTGVFSEIPNCTCSAAEIGVTGQVHCSVVNSSTTAGVVYTGQSSTAKNTEVQIHCARGSDYKQFDQRFIPVTDKKTEEYQAHTHAGYGSGAAFIPYFSTEVKNTISHWGTMTNDATDGNVFTAGANCSPCLVTVKYGGAADGSARTVGLSLNSTQLGTAINTITASDRKSAVYLTASSTGEDAKWVGLMNTGDTLRPHNAAAFTPSTTSYVNYSLVVQPAELKAFIGNLTPKEFVQTPGSTKPVIYSCDVDLNSGTPANGSNLCSQWVSSYTDNAVGDVTINLTAGKFSQEPTCNFSANTNDQLINFALVSKSTSAVRIRVRQNTTLTDYDFGIICHGVQ